MNLTKTAHVRSAISPVVTPPSQELESIPGLVINARPEWLRVADATGIFGIGKTFLYELIAQNKIRSTSLRKRGAVRGIRLINFESLREYCDTAADHGGIEV